PTRKRGNTLLLTLTPNARDLRYTLQLLLLSTHSLLPYETHEMNHKRKMKHEMKALTIRDYEACMHTKKTKIFLHKMNVDVNASTIRSYTGREGRVVPRPDLELWRELLLQPDPIEAMMPERTRLPIQ